MPAITTGNNFINNLSAFWQRFFADSPQLEALYSGTAVLLGQAYLDLLGDVLNIALQDAPVFNKEYYKLIFLREDQLAYVRGATFNSWAAELDEGLVQFASLDNRVLEPTVSLQNHIDYTLGDGAIYFVDDPTDPLHNGVPAAGFARRAVDTTTGGSFDDEWRPLGETWSIRGVYKGDVLRLLDVTPMYADDTVPNNQQRKRSDHSIVLVRDTQLYVSADTPLPKLQNMLDFVILRTPSASQVTLEMVSFAPPDIVTGLEVASLVHSRVDKGSVRIFAKASDGSDVQEGRDYTVDYERGKIIKVPGLPSWALYSVNKINYTWKQEVWPITGGLVPRFCNSGIVRASPVSGTAVTARVLQIALWAPDALVDRGNLANNFGSLIGFTEPSSESYRAFLRGIFQLYVLGPVLERVESALNVILGLPVIRDDGEVFLSLDTTSPDFNRINMTRANKSTATYDFPKGTPLRTDLVAGLVLAAFEPLTTAATVTDYIQDPTWWHHVIIPAELFSTAAGASVPSPLRRTVSPIFVKHMIGAAGDYPKIGDPRLKIGADDEGLISTPPIYRRRVAFVLMDRYFKMHSFFVQFAPGVFAGTNVARYARSFEDLQKLISGAKPKHTFVFMQPVTVFHDEVATVEDGFFQPPNQSGQDPDGPEVFTDASETDPAYSNVHLGLFINLTLGSFPGGSDKVVFQDNPPQIGVNGWTIGDYFYYESATLRVSFPTANVPVSIAGTPTPPRRSRLVRIYVWALISAQKVVEGIDYTVDYDNRTVTRKTTWDTGTSIDVSYIHANIGNVADGPATPSIGDMPLLIGGIDPANARAVYDPTAIDWLGNPVTVPGTSPDHRDLSLVERPLITIVTSVSM